MLFQPHHRIHIVIRKLSLSLSLISIVFSPFVVDDDDDNELHGTHDNLLRDLIRPFFLLLGSTLLGERNRQTGNNRSVHKPTREREREKTMP